MFGIISDSFFVPLASPNKLVYWECICKLFSTMESYKPYMNTLTETELETLCRLYGKAEGKEKEILFRIIHKYGADKLEI